MPTAIKTGTPEKSPTNPATSNDAPASVLKLIQGWQWFAYVPPEAHAWLAKHATLSTMAKGKVLYVSGDRAVAIYAVVSGAFRIYLASPKGDEITLEEVIPGGWFPHMVPDEDPHYLLNCACLQDATVAVVPVAVMSEFARLWPGYFRGLYHEFTKRAVATFGRIELLSLHNLNVRIAVYLLRMAHLRGVREPKGSLWIPALDSQAEVGARVGGTRQRVNAILKAWSAKGLVECHKDGIRVLEVGKLGAEAKKSGFELEKYLAGWHGGWGRAKPKSKR